MSDKKPLVLGIDSATGALITQQVQPQDQVDPTTLPYYRENSNSKLIRILIRDLVGMNFPLSQELIDELQKPT